MTTIDFRKSQIFLDKAKQSSIESLDLIEALLSIRAPLAPSDPLICLCYHFSEQLAASHLRRAENVAATKPVIHLYLPNPGTEVYVDKALINQHINFVEEVTGVQFPFNQAFLGLEVKFKLFNMRRVLHQLQVPILDAGLISSTRRKAYDQVRGHLLNVVSKLTRISDLYQLCSDALNHELVDLETALVIFTIGYLKGTKSLLSVIYDGLYTDDHLISQSDQRPVSPGEFFAAAIHRRTEMNRFSLVNINDLESWIQHVEKHGDALNVVADFAMLWSAHPWIKVPQAPQSCCCSSESRRDELHIYGYGSEPSRQSPPRLPPTDFQLSEREETLWQYVEDSVGCGNPLMYMKGIYDLVDPIKISMKLLRTYPVIGYDVMEVVQTIVLYNLSRCNDITDLVRYLRATTSISRPTKLRIFAAFAFFSKAYAYNLVSCSIKHRFHLPLDRRRFRLLTQDDLSTIFESAVVYMDLTSIWKCSCLNQRLRQFCLEFKEAEIFNAVMEFSSGHIYPDPFKGILPPVLKVAYQNLSELKSWLHFGAWFITRALEVYRRREDPFTLNPNCSPRNNICCDLHYRAVQLQFAGFRAFWRVHPVPAVDDGGESPNIGAPRHILSSECPPTNDGWFPSESLSSRSGISHFKNGSTYSTPCTEVTLQDIVRTHGEPSGLIPLVVKSRIAYAKQSLDAKLVSSSPIFLYGSQVRLDIPSPPRSQSLLLPSQHQKQLEQILYERVAGLAELIKTEHHLRSSSKVWRLKTSVSESTVSTVFRLDAGLLAVDVCLPSGPPLLASQDTHTSSSLIEIPSVPPSILSM
eukprot:Blabericola_migrator_1__6150@NODE_30_length_19081_cov_136_854686_g26_i0_p4_GENE_NODE_30_length_19081_cov_136_854686_g26_i0NODE_30_length_19081_cov_136_854686_g26_i0_p4_ORF_typecomplete_len808_score86_39_NODE_30_length_19081_cov_136_854686_g26_i01082531